jgi:hypothetical protein
MILTMARQLSHSSPTWYIRQAATREILARARRGGQERRTRKATAPALGRPNPASCGLLLLNITDTSNMVAYI